MAQVRVSDWTLEKLHEIKGSEDHTSLDSVIKVLIAERESNE